MASVHNIDESKSYATLENLEKALRKFGFHEDRYVVVCTSTGRYTAIFPASNIQGGGYMGRYAIRGFLTLG